MIRNKICVASLLLASMGSVFADTPASLVSGYAAEAGAGFTPSAQRGQAFFNKEWAISQKMPNCTVCHGKNLKIGGKHVVTDKPIDALSPAVNAERFTSRSKVEKWFKRNCKEVVGRECTPAEKADFIQYISQGV